MPEIVAGFVDIVVVAVADIDVVVVVVADIAGVVVVAVADNAIVVGVPPLGVEWWWVEESREPARRTGPGHEHSCHNSPLLSVEEGEEGVSGHHLE